MSLFGLLFVFFTKYLIPLLFAIGLLCFIYGLIEYFIIGREGDEERSEHGRSLFLQAIGWFVLALLVHGLITLVGWIGTIAATPTGNLTPSAGGEVRETKSILEVPDVPKR